MGDQEGIFREISGMPERKNTGFLMTLVGGTVAGLLFLN